MKGKPPARPSRSDESGETAERARRLSADEPLSYLTKEAMRAYSRSMQIRLVDHSVSLGHWLFLRALWAEDGLTQRELSERVGLMESTTFTALKALEGLGYLVRVKKPGNRKNVHLFLTPTGRQLQSSLVPLSDGLNARAIEGIAAADVATTRRTLVRIIENLTLDERQLAESERHLPSTREVSQLVTKRPARKRAGGRKPAKRKPAS